MKHWKHLSLRSKFMVGMGVVFLVGVVVSGVILWRLLERRAEMEVTNRGIVLIETMNAVRRYTSEQVNPLLQDDLQRESEFISQSVPAFSARAVFSNFRSSEHYADYVYKEATLNPTNPLNRADLFETELVNQFRADTSLTEVSGFRTLDGELMFYNARPLAVSSGTCLACHGSAENAPASLINTYGTESGFGWQLGEIVTAQMIYVPASEVFETARQEFVIVMGVVIVVFAAIMLYVARMVRTNVGRPIGLMAALATKISADEVRESDIDNEALCKIMERGDELGQMAKTFNKMAHEVVRREAKLKQEVIQLRIEIDHAKKQQQVDEITGTEYFQQLQQRAREMRRGMGTQGLTPGAAEG